MPDPTPPSWLGKDPPLELLAGPGAFYFAGEDSLQLVTFNTAAGVSLVLAGRFLTVEGELRPFRLDQTPNSAGTADTKLIGMGEGWLLNCSVIVSAGTPTGTQCISLVRVVRGLSGPIQVLGVLAQGALTASQDVSWPLTSWSSMGTGAAATTIKPLAFGAPGAGNEVAITVPAGKRWKFLGIAFPLTTSATVANREVAFAVDDGSTNLVLRVPSAFNQVASTTVQYYYGALASVDALQNTDKTRPFPQLTATAGEVFKTSTINLQAGDTYGVQRILVEESAA